LENVHIHSNALNFLQLLHENERTEINEGNKKHFCSFLSELTQTVRVNVYCCLQRDRVTVVLSVLLYSTFTVQIQYELYSVKLNCTYSNYTQAAATCLAPQQHTNCQADVF
jgi:hypothetical protein